MLLSESKICKNIKKKSRCKLKHRRKDVIQTIHGLRQAAAAAGWAEGRHHCALSPSLLSHLSLCFRLSTVLPGMLSPDPERSQSSFWWSNPHHFPSQERRSTAPGVTAAVHLSEVAWDPPPPPQGVRMAANLRDPAQAKRRAWPERKSLTQRLALRPVSPPKHSTLSANCHISMGKLCHIYIAHSTRMRSPDPSQCHRWPRGKQSQGHLEFSIIPPRTWSW